MRADCSGNVTKEDADAWLRQVDPGGPFHGLPILAVTLQLNRVASEARSVFAQRGDVAGFKAWMAVVVTNPVIRVTTNFVMRMARNTKQRIFATEQEAILWLDERLREDAVKKEAR
ncbi:MAG TPA: hypothetical protein VND93_05270 [Myxococcales bacterium]|nr:hypothetical protein [Myxococcales bacterium]